MQVQHLRLGGGGGAHSAPAAAAAPPYASSLHSDGGYGYAGGRKPDGAAGSVGEEGDGSVQETASLAGSRDVFSELHEYSHQPAHGSQPRRQGHQQPSPPQQPSQQRYGGGGSSAAAPAASAYQQQLHQHIDTLASKLSNFQRAVDEARQVGQQASQQVRAPPRGQQLLMPACCCSCCAYHLKPSLIGRLLSSRPTAGREPQHAAG